MLKNALFLLLSVKLDLNYELSISLNIYASHLENNSGYSI